MNSSHWFRVSVLIVLAAAAVGCSEDMSAQPALGIDQSAGANFDESRLDTEPPPFIALDDPLMVPASQADWLDGDDIVLGFVHDSGEAYAFPTSQMSFHHVANITVAGEPYLVTF